MFTALRALFLFSLVVANPVEVEERGNAGPKPATASLRTVGGSKVTVTGVSANGTDIYYGIPFAQPPIGNLRFEHPKPYVWATDQKAFNATQWAPSCIQDTHGQEGALGAPYAGLSEDCLTLNIVTPRGAARSRKRLPVLVWIYGGGFVEGAANLYVPHMGTVVHRGVETDRPFIYVSINYRLGILGFGYGKEIAAHGASNLGLRDQRVALEWVRDNIKAFGGDPNKVTVAGQSAGAISIGIHMLNTTQDLFRGAIMVSGAPVSSPIGEAADNWQGMYDGIANATGCAGANSTATANSTAAANSSSSAPASPAGSALAGNHSSFDCLKAVTAESILAAQIQVKSRIEYSFSFPFSPAIDGDLITGRPVELLKNGSLAKIPFITGNVKDEGTGSIPTSVAIPDSLIASVINFFYPRPIPADITAAVLTAYPDIPALGAPYGTGNDTFGLPSNYKRLASLVGDSAFHSRRRHLLRQANDHGFANSWTYQFEGGLPGSPTSRGVAHGDDLFYWFGLADKTTNATDAQVTLSKQAMDYWINFAYFLNPNGKRSGGKNKYKKNKKAQVPLWRTHDFPRNKNLLQLRPDNVTIVQDDFREDQMAVFFNETVAKALFYKKRTVEVGH